MTKIKKVLIEKYLCDPQDGCTIYGPSYAVSAVYENGDVDLVDIVECDIKDALRKAERILDFDIIEVAYNENPASFQSVTPVSLENHVPENQVVVLTDWSDVERFVKICDSVRHEYDQGFWGEAVSREEFCKTVFERLKKGEAL